MLRFQRKESPVCFHTDDPQQPFLPGTQTVLIISDDEGPLRSTKVIVKEGSKIVQESITDKEGKLILDDPSLMEHEIKVTLG